MSKSEDVVRECDRIIEKMETVLRILNDSECQKELTKQDYRELCLELVEGNLDMYRGMKNIFGGW